MQIKNKISFVRFFTLLTLCLGVAAVANAQGCPDGKCHLRAAAAANASAPTYSCADGQCHLRAATSPCASGQCHLRNQNTAGNQSAFYHTAGVLNQSPFSASAAVISQPVVDHVVTSSVHPAPIETDNFYPSVSSLAPQNIVSEYSMDYRYNYITP